MTARYAVVESLSSDHETDDFDCGSVAQTQWLRKYALISHTTGVSRVKVVCESGTKRVVGYYALATGSIAHADAAAGVKGGMPRYPIPVVLLTRLGVDQREQGNKLGTALVVDAIRRVLAAADEIGIRALLIHAEDQAARDFYMHLAEFEESPSDPLHLMLRLEALKATAGA